MPSAAPTIASEETSPCTPIRCEQVSSAAQARQWKEAGALLLAYSSDADVLHGGFARAMAEIKGGR